MKSRVWRTAQNSGGPSINYVRTQGEGGGGQVSNTFPLRITCKKGGGEGVQIACKIAYVLNGRPLGRKWFVKIH